MKQFISLVFAGIIGGMMTLGGVAMMKNDAPSQNASLAQNVNNVNIKPSTANVNVPFDFTYAAEKATPAVVHILAKETRPQNNQPQRRDPFDFFFGDFRFDMPKEGTGSGVIYSDNGYIITNNHVVGFADDIEVTLSDDRTFKAELIGAYPEADLAVLKIEANRLPTLDIADSDAARIGEWVLAIGNPFELNSTVTAGIISAKGRDIGVLEGQSALEAFIQTDAVVNPGNSGGALVDAKGQLLGINTAIQTNTGFYQGYSFAIPTKIVLKVVNDIIDFGSYQKGYLGIGVADLVEEDILDLQLADTKGVLVMETYDDGAAIKAGIMTNDVIKAIDGQKVDDAPALLGIIGGLRKGETIRLTVLRDGETQEIPVVLKAQK